MTGYLSILLFLSSAVLFTGFFRPQNRVDFIITFFCMMVAQIVISANTISYFEHLNSLGAWVLTGFLFLSISVLLSIFQVKKNKSSFRVLHYTGQFPFNRKWFSDLSTFEKFVFIPLIGSVIIIGLINLFLVLNLAPGNHDSMTSHLARIAYYLQQGSYAFFEANFWGQVVHPRNATSLFLYSYLVTGNENLTQIVQYISYWIAIVSVYGISSRSGMSRNQSLFSALICGLLISVLMQANTTQNDLLLTAFVGSVVYYFFSFKKTGNHDYLILASIAIAISLGVKASIVLAMVPVSFIAVWSLNSDTLKKQVNSYLFTAGAFLISLMLFTLPSGYLFNIQKFGHPLGTETVRDAHTFESESTTFILKNGVRNSLRYTIEFVSLDGLPTISHVRKIQKRIRGYSQSHFDKYVTMPDFDFDDLDLTENPPTIEYSGNRFLIHYLMEPIASRAQFNYFKMPTAREDFSYWGIFGFGLVWLTLSYSLIARNVPSGIKILAIAAIIFFLLQAFSGPYDPWRGRHFNIAAIFALPSAGFILYTNYKFLKGYLLIIIAIGCISAFSGVILKSGHISVAEPGEPSNLGEYKFEFLFTKNRIEQLTRLGPYYEPIQAFETLVPPDASVAIYLPGDSYEYPLFGKNFSRKLYPINSFINGVKPVPEHVQYLLYSAGYPDANYDQDMLLGTVIQTKWYLRSYDDK